MPDFYKIHIFNTDIIFVHQNTHQMAMQFVC